MAAMTSPTIASGHGNSHPPNESPSRESAAMAPTTASRTVRVRWSTLITPSSLPSSGMSSQPAAYTKMPPPPKIASSTSPTRTSSGSTSKWRAMPPATPAILRSVRLRRMRPRSLASSRVTRGPLDGGGSGSTQVLGGPGGPGGSVEPLGASGGVFVMCSSLCRRALAHHRGVP